MFGIHLRQLYRTCDKFIIRNLRRPRLESANPNPGLDNRINAFQSDGFQIRDNDVEELVDQSESDFYNIGESYKEHVKEKFVSKKQLRHYIVKEKYFKENLPNLLTWSEKEQIRHLANTEPDEWTPEKIAESFPVTAHAVKKLLKYPWKPASEQRITRHDESAMRNWRELKEGSIDIPPELKKHFLKFVNRSIPPLNKNSIKIDITPEQNIGEFEQIVRRCATKESDQPIDNSEELSISNIPNSTGKKVNSVKKDPKLVTLDELTQKIQKRLNKGSDVDINDRILINSVNEKNNTDSVKVKSELQLVDDDSKDSIVEYKDKTVNPKEVMEYPDRIRIPRSAYKKGATYKVNDCYYDHDGIFLYRVLGLTQ